MVLLSTLHCAISIPKVENPKHKPDTVLLYNITKVGVDMLDQMLRSMKPACRRRSVHVFSNIVDIALLNSWILYKGVTKSTMSCCVYIQSAVEGLLREAPRKTSLKWMRNNVFSVTPANLDGNEAA